MNSGKFDTRTPLGPTNDLEGQDVSEIKEKLGGHQGAIGRPQENST